MASDQQRIFCPRCRANNFLGQTNCWQCGASLPPPEAGAYVPSPANILRGAPMQPSQIPVQHPPQWQANPNPPFDTSSSSNRKIWFVVIPVILVLIGVIFYLMSMLNSKKAGPTDDLHAQIERLKQQEKGMMDNRNKPTGTDEVDETTQAAKREIQRLREKQGLTAPNPDADGSITLQTGGKITSEDWDKARRSLRKSSTYNPP